MPRPDEGIRLNPRAERDVDEIWDYSAGIWGVGTANAYVGGLRSTLSTIAASPLMARERTEITPPVRVYPYRSHLVIYRVDGDEIAVLRVFHSRRNWLREMGV